jgi:hypothetical protein
MPIEQVVVDQAQSQGQNGHGWTGVSKCAFPPHSLKSQIHRSVFVRTEVSNGRRTILVSPAFLAWSCAVRTSRFDSSYFSTAPQMRSDHGAHYAGRHPSRPSVPSQVSAPSQTSAFLIDCPASWRSINHQLCPTVKNLVWRSIDRKTAPVLDPPGESLPASDHRHKLPAGYRVVETSVLGGLHHEYGEGGRLTWVCFADHRSVHARVLLA